MSPILITGAAQRVGLHCALSLVKQGYRVVATYRSEKPGLMLLEQAGVELIQADFSSIEQIQRFIDQFKQHHACLRAIVHNASGWYDDQQIQQHPALLMQMFSVHVQAPYELNQQLAGLLYNHSGALRDIVHLSDYTVKVGHKDYAGYVATKAGLQSLTQSFAQKYAPVDGRAAIQVNAIAPGLIMFNEGDDPAYREAAKAKSILHIEPGPQVVYQTLQYILDNPYITGNILPLDGGRHLRGV